VAPEVQTEPGSSPRLPSIKRRLLSQIYEALLLCGVLFLAGVLYFGLIGSAESGWRRHAFQAYLFVVIGTYFIVSWHRHGQTLPMKTWKLRLIGVDGNAVSWRQAVWRYLLAWPSIALCGIGILYAYFDRERQFLHDRLANTRLIQVQRP